MGSISYRNRNKGRVDKHGRPLKARWEYRFDGAPVRGKRNVFSKGGFATKQEAIAAGVKAQNEYLSTGVVFKETTMSYADCLDNWMENYVKIRCLHHKKDMLDRQTIPVDCVLCQRSKMVCTGN